MFPTDLTLTKIMTIKARGPDEAHICASFDAIQVEDLGYAYPGSHVQALIDVSLTVTMASLTAITGPSGSGKSTLMHCMAGLLRPDKGRVAVLGNEVHSLGEPDRTAFRRRHLGFVFQQPGLLEDLSAVDNVAVPGWAAGRKRREADQRARLLLEEVGLGDLAHRLPGELSGGQAQRVGLARALMNEPQVIFADEPTGALDSVAGRHVLELLRSAADRGCAVVLVTHERPLAEQADHEIALNDGRVVIHR